MTRSIRLVLAVFVAAVAVLVSGVSAPVGAADGNPIHPDNRPTTITGATNGAIAEDQLLQVSPDCLAYYRAAPSLGSLLAAAAQGRHPARPRRVLPRLRRPGEGTRGLVCHGRMRHGRGARHVQPRVGQSRRLPRSERRAHVRQRELRLAEEPRRLVRLESPGRDGAGGSVPEPWHWEWVGDGGRMFPGSTFGFGNAFGIALGGDPTGHLDGTSQTTLNGWFGSTTVGAGPSIPIRRARPMSMSTSMGSVWPLKANKPRPDVAALFAGYDTSPHGFSGTIPVVYGKREICAYGINTVGSGDNALLNCTIATIGQDPTGSFDSATVGTGITVRGWALDADSTGDIDVHAYVNGVFAGAVTANTGRPDVDGVFPRNGSAHGFDMTVPAQQGTSNVCVYAINTGAGSNALVGCKTLTSNRMPFGFLDSVRACTGRCDGEWVGDRPRHHGRDRGAHLHRRHRRGRHDRRAIAPGPTGSVSDVRIEPRLQPRRTPRARACTTCARTGSTWARAATCC